MTIEQRLKNLSVPKGKIDVVLDTDTYNEIDDQFALAYLLTSKEKLNTKAIYAAPFFNARSNGPEEGMEKSYAEIKKILSFMKEKVDAFKGSKSYLPDENTPVESDAADDLIKRAKSYSAEKPLYVVAIGAITNIASALIKAPEIAENIVIVWLGGHARHFHDTNEFNMKQDIAAARVIMKSGAPFVQLPCMGVVSGFTVSKPELEYWFKGKNELADYLAKSTVYGTLLRLRGCSMMMTVLCCRESRKHRCQPMIIIIPRTLMVSRCGMCITSTVMYFLPTL